MQTYDIADGRDAATVNHMYMQEAILLQIKQITSIFYRSYTHQILLLKYQHQQNSKSELNEL